tara:strand:- start:39 stop:605 length:567 start_codon:yes stop_codon:yes gene_type:complete
MGMKVLVACEFSGVVRDAFRKRGYDAWSCDILPSDKSDYHIHGNVLNHLDESWDIMIAHPPCTRLCNSGVRWLNERNLWQELEKATKFFNDLKNADIDKICVENPIPHKYAKQSIGNYTQIIQPYQFGHGETKATCLWLKNLPKLIPTNIVEGRDNRIHNMSPSKDRSKLRSITYYGIAEAMAEQWGN